jgi:hypothetical protein
MLKTAFRNFEKAPKDTELLFKNFWVIKLIDLFLQDLQVTFSAIVFQIIGLFTETCHGKFENKFLFYFKTTIFSSVKIL